MGSTRFRNPRALSSALATLGTLRPRALGFLNPVDPMDSISNLYLVNLPVISEAARDCVKGVLVMRVVGELGVDDIKVVYAPPVVI